MKIEEVPVDGVRVLSRHRASLVEAKVAALVESIGAVGLLQPITVYTPDDASVYLVAGAHRLEAAKRLGWYGIAAVFMDADEIDREIAEIDENLCRANLTPVEEALQLARRKVLWEQRRHLQQVEKVLPPVKPHGHSQAQGFAAGTAALTGETKASVNQKIGRAKRIAADVLEEVKGSDLDKGVVLDTLKRLDHEEQRQAIDRVQSGASQTVQDAYEFIRGEAPKPKASKQPPSKKQQVARLMAAWEAADSEAREEFRAFINSLQRTDAGQAA